MQLRPLVGRKAKGMAREEGRCPTKGRGTVEQFCAGQELSAQEILTFLQCCAELRNSSSLSMTYFGIGATGRTTRNARNYRLARKPFVKNGSLAVYDNCQEFILSNR
jgi:hypothetical protein